MMTSGSAVNDPSVKEQLAGMLGFLRRVLRFWRVPLASLLLGGLAFGVYSHFRQPKFRSETVILYVQKGSSDEDTESTDAQHAVTARLKELLFSRPNLERVVSRFNLYPELRKGYGMVDGIEELKRHVEFKAPGGDTFSIAFEGEGASEAQRVTAELARLVIVDDAELRTGQAKVALGFLAGERQARDAELRDTEGKLAAFMAEHPRFALDATPLANGAAIRASIGGVKLGPAVGRVQWAPRSLPGTLGVMATPGSPAAAAATGKGADGDELRARAELATARDSLTEKLTLYTPVHPDVRAAEAAVQRATQRLAAVTPAAVTKPPEPATNQAPAPSAPTRAASPAPRAVAVVAGPVSPGLPQDLVALETAWLTLTRAVTEARQRLDQIEAQLFRADILMSSESAGHGAQVNVIDPAFLPERPLPPGRALLALIFLAAALVLGGLGALGSAAFDDRLFEARDLAGIGEVLAEVPGGRRLERP
jgi:hypothetical protein